MDKKCSRCGAKYREDESCGKTIHDSLPPRPVEKPELTDPRYDAYLRDAKKGNDDRR